MVTRNSRSGITAQFALIGSSTDSARHEQLYLHGVHGRPERGTYILRPVALEGLDRGELLAFYSHRVKTTLHSYVARTGSVEITSSAADRIEGVVQMTGVEYCASSVSGPPVIEGPCSPSEVRPDASSIEVLRSFTAVPEPPARFDPR